VLTLLTLMTRHPRLAEGPMYLTVADMLSAPAGDLQHRQAWAQGRANAIDEWWDHLPRPPKQWWRNWRDALL
jgi:hypothetical protein